MAGTEVHTQRVANAYVPMLPPARQPRTVASNINPGTFCRASLPADIEFLHRFGIGYPTLYAAAARAAEYGISSSGALISSGALSEEDYYRCAAFELGLDYTDHTPMSGEPFIKTPTPEQLSKMARMVTVDQFGRTFHIAPDMSRRDELEELLRCMPLAKNRLKATRLSANIDMLQQRSGFSLMRTSIDQLVGCFPELSAKTVFTVKQALALLVVLQALAIIAFYSAGAVLLGVHLFATLFYLGCVGIRLFAALNGDISKRATKPVGWEKPDRSADGRLPFYTVMIALYKEASQVDDLVASLQTLDWPVEKLEIKLVCEADDLETVAAVHNATANKYASHIHLVCVPAEKPRTKPKALNYALPLCRGRYLVIYDAEDRPDPLQLREAYAAFTKGADNLVCLQAPLIIHNHQESWLSRLFTIEYSALFDGLLPMLSKHKLPLPLGGTSNHFKRAALEKAGAWDPYNVTEDADLGIRFARLGYQIGTIARPTFEEAPIELPIWLKQRTRWFKGWLQTWLVHMRSPRELTKDLGFRGSLAFHLMITGMIISALVHPILLYLIGAGAMRAYLYGVEFVMSQPMFWLDVTTIILGYFSFGLLAWRTLPQRGLVKLRGSLWGLPAYWLLLSVAAWRAVWHLFRRPHEWEKTPHRMRIKETMPAL